MRRKLYVSFALTAVLVAVLGLAACGGGGGEQAVQEEEYTGPVQDLVVWHAYQGGEKDAFEAVIADFNASQKRYDVTTLAVPYDAYADKITAAVPRGKGPDVFIFAQDRLGGWVEAGNTIESLDFFIEDDVRARFLDLPMEAMTYRGTTYGLPFNYKVVTMIYNKALVDTPPTTDAELVATAEKLTNAAAGNYGLAYSYSDFYYHSALMNAYGGGVFNADAQPVIDQPANVRSIDKMLEWVRKDGILPAEPSTALINSLFNEGKAGIVFSGPWFLGEIDPSIEYGLAKLPYIEDAGAPMKPWVTVEGIYVAAPSEHKDGAYELAKYLTDVPAARRMALEGRQTPANKAVYDDPEVANDPVLSAFRAQVEDAVPMPNLAEMSITWSPVTTAMNAILKGTSPQAALTEAQEKVQADVDRLRSEG
jgi:arabinogalactan oligomer/maltooligosaccharide transport system substrate-binding protein